MPADPLGALKAAIDGASLTPTPGDKVWVGGFGHELLPSVGVTILPPFAQIRSRGGPRAANWQPEAMRRVDLFCYGKDYNEADTLATAIDTFLRELYNFEYHYLPDRSPHAPSRNDVETTTRIQFVNTESDGIDGIDDDTNLPFMFRSYIIAYQEI